MRAGALVLVLTGLFVFVPFIVLASGAACQENCSPSNGLVIAGVAGLVTSWAGAAWLSWKARARRKSDDGS